MQVKFIQTTFKEKLPDR